MTEMLELGTTPHPLKGESHSEIEIKILEIKDANGTSIMGGGTEYDPRQFAVKGGAKTTIKYELKNDESFVLIEIRPDPGNAVATKYYAKASAKEFTDYVSPGQHTIEWDGRSRFDGWRLLIQGEYKVTAWAACNCGNEVTDETKIKVKKPYADSYGATYPASYGTPSNLSPPAAHVRTTLASLSDGSGFECGGSATASASEALDRMHDFSAVWYWDGHAGPGRIVFYDAAGVNKTRIVTNDAVGAALGMAAGSFGAVEGLSEGALDHVFLVVLLGCNTAETPPEGSSLPEALVGRGVDLVLAFPKKVYLRSYLKWTRDFFQALDNGNSVRGAARQARNLAARADRRRLSHRLFAGGGASTRDKLLPARNGRWKRGIRFP
jgi:hypothetical protein